jgi:hypothetical protein
MEINGDKGGLAGYAAGFAAGQENELAAVRAARPLVGEGIGDLDRFATVRACEGKHSSRPPEGARAIADTEPGQGSLSGLLG